MFKVYEGRVAQGSDLVVYWHEKARAMVESGRVDRVGLLATQGIRGSENRRVLDRMKETGDIFLAWSDENWVLDGAAVHVSFVAFDNGTEKSRTLNGQAVLEINADLTAGIDLTKVPRLAANLNISFMGDSKGGPFNIDADTAHELLSSHNPDGRSNADVVVPWFSGKDLTQRPRGRWIIDFGVNMPIDEAALYEAPFEYVKQHVMPNRVKNNRQAYADRWWIHVEPRVGLRKAIAGLDRFIGTTRHSKHRLFSWIAKGTLPDSAIFVFARDDDYFFGVLHSRAHEVWARGTGTQVREVESGFRYTPTTTFETFPLPDPTVDQRSNIAKEAAALDSLRTGWLNPSGMDETELQKRTLTNLYNQQPTWLVQAHDRLDRAVYAAYGWAYPMNDEDVLASLASLNTERTAQSV